jgi:formate dehydrogenase gamma subunit
MSTVVNRYYERFSIYERIEHIFMLLSFTTLAITGLPQKYPEAGVSQFIIGLFGGIEFARSVHHFAATILMLATVYHIVAVGYKVYVKRVQMSMLPGLQDARDALQAFLYNIGIGKTRPQMGRFTFEEKAEYWALVWGTAIMAITGFMMWNPIATARFLPGEVIPAAKAAHGAEAVLAVLAIIVWHMYGVHLKRFNKAMWTGKMSEEEMLHEHPLELADIKAGVYAQEIDATILKKRRNVYYPIATVVSIVLLGGIYAFVTLEMTSIKTVVPPPSSDIPVYVPQTPTPVPTVAPTATTAVAAPAATLTWDGFAGPLFQQKCAACHGAAAIAGLNLTTYADAIKGSAKGPVILPKDSANSKLIQVQSAGAHPGQLTPDELNQIKAWIDTGALEK